MLFIFIFSSPQLDEKFYRSTFRLFGEKSIKLLSLVEAPSSDFSSPPVAATSLPVAHGNGSWIDFPVGRWNLRQ